MAFYPFPFIAELVYVTLPPALGDFHVRNNSVLFLPRTQRVLNAQKSRENERTIIIIAVISMFDVQGTNMKL